MGWILSLISAFITWYSNRRKTPYDALRKEAEGFAHPSDNDDDVIRKL